MTLDGKQHLSDCGGVHLLFCHYHRRRIRWYLHRSVVAGFWSRWSFCRWWFRFCWYVMVYGKRCCCCRCCYGIDCVEKCSPLFPIRKEKSSKRGKTFRSGSYSYCNKYYRSTKYFSTPYLYSSRVLRTRVLLRTEYYLHLEIWFSLRKPKMGM